MKTPPKRATLKRRFVSLIFVIAGALCVVASKSDPSIRLSPLAIGGIALMIAGVVIRLTAKRS